MDVADQIMGVESGGNPASQNSLSSAGGLGQFIDSTWLSMIGKYRPDLAGMDRSSLLAMKTDPGSADLQRDMTRAYVGENRDYLTANGFDPTPGNVYLAHFLGPAGARSVLSANPGAPIGSVVGPGVVSANPFLAGMSAGDVINWTAKKMGGAAPLASGLSNPSPTAGLLASAATSAPAKDKSSDDDGDLKGLLARFASKQDDATPTAPRGSGLLGMQDITEAPGGGKGLLFRQLTIKPRKFA